MLKIWAIEKIRDFNYLRRVNPSYFLYKYQIFRKESNKRMKCTYDDKNCYFYNNKNCNRGNQKCLKEIDNTSKIKKDAQDYWDRLRKGK